MENTDPASGSPDPVEPPQAGEPAAPPADDTVSFTKTTTAGSAAGDASGEAPGGTPPPPPPSDPWQGVRRLRRTRDPRVIAGVCGGLGRATNIDPILFRVILAVLVVFGGLGLGIYLILWLVLPLEGEDASPLEALFGRGRSSTGPVLTVALGVVAVLATVSTVGDFGHVILGAAVVVGLVLLLQRSGVLPAGEYVGFTRPAPPAYAGQATAPGTEPGYTPPFAPRGPWGGHAHWRGHHGSPVPPVPPAPPVPRRRRERSSLGRLTLSLICLALAALGAIDLAGASVNAVAYWGTALGVTALGLLIGTWFGRARGLIFLGILLSIGMTGAGVAHNATNDKWHQDVHWAPTSVSTLAPSYETGAGKATLDLTKVDFVGHTEETRVKLGAGDLRIQLPPNVDVRITASLGAGNANIFGAESNGLRIDRTVIDPGADGTGGGSLTLNVELGVGDLEIAR